MLSAEGQAAFASEGFRPIDGTAVTDVEGANDPADPFPQPTTLLTIDDDFGGWSAANEKFFQEDTGVVTKHPAGDRQAVTTARTRPRLGGALATTSGHRAHRGVGSGSAWR